MNRALVCAGILAWGAAAQAESLRIGTETDYAPYIFLSESGALQGFDKDLGDAICAEGGFTCEWVTMPFDQLVDQVAAGAIDLAIAGMADTPTRREKVDFSRPYRPSAPGWGVFAALRPGLTAEGALVAVQSGTIYVDALTDAGYAIAEYTDMGAMVAALRAGAVDVIFGGAGNIDHLIATVAPDLRVVDSLMVDDYPTAIAITRKRKGLTARIDAILTSLEAAGLLSDLEQRWFPDGTAL